MATYKKICECCGKEYEARSFNSRFCYDDHFVKCEICGKEYKISRAQLLDRGPIGVCSRKCANEKAKRTNLIKYGVENVGQLEETHDKMKETSRRIYGTDHPMQSQTVKDKVEATNLDVYGVKCVFQNEEVKSKIDETNMKVYGHRRPLQNEEVKAGMVENNNEKFGGNSPLCNKDIQEKSKQTNLNHLGVEWPGMSEDVRNKAKETCVELYGNENYTRSQDYKDKVPELSEKARATLMNNYGAPTYNQSQDYQDKKDDIIAKARKTTFDRYGCTDYGQSREFRQKFMTDPSKIDDLMSFLNDPNSYIDRYDKNPTVLQLMKDLGVTQSTIDSYIHRFQLIDRVKMKQSTMEQEVIDFIKSIRNFEIIRNTRQVINPLEIDIYLPDYQLGIECDPTSTHNSSIGCFPGDQPKEYRYHQHKTDLAEKNDVFLFHIFGYEWYHKQDIIKSMIMNLLGYTEYAIYGRNCEVREVSDKDCNVFLTANHRQGNASSHIRLGLYNDDELVSVMTFGKMRSGIGTGNEDLSNCYELVRFCNKLNTTVLGGASKLFKHFLDDYGAKRIRSFSDRAHTSGNLYSILGFKEIRRSEPGYVWVDYKTDVAYNRVTCMKSNLKSFLNDDTIDLSRTEREIMEEHGFVRVYDSGTITWEYVL